jgi:RNA methyltransferase, TrmH family
MPPARKSVDSDRGASFANSLLSSRENRWLKEFRMALRGGLPTESGAVGVEGPRLVEEALRSASSIRAVLFSESGERHRSRLSQYLNRPEVSIPVLRTTDRLFEGIADTEQPQGVAALVIPRSFSFDDISRTASSGVAPLIIVLAGVQDPGNVGTILRTASAFGATAAVASPSGQSGTANPYAPKSLRASAGAALHLPLLTGMALPILLAQFRVIGIQSLASSSRESSERESSENAKPLLAPWEVDWRQPVALLIGNEGAGLPEEIERSADVRIRIPMSSSVESLNAAAAAAVLFYEAARQRSSLA